MLEGVEGCVGVQEWIVWVAGQLQSQGPACAKANESVAVPALIPTLQPSLPLLKRSTCSPSHKPHSVWHLKNHRRSGLGEHLEIIQSECPIHRWGNRSMRADETCLPKPMTMTLRIPASVLKTTGSHGGCGGEGRQGHGVARCAPEQDHRGKAQR